MIPRPTPRVPKRAPSNGGTGRRRYGLSILANRPWAARLSDGGPFFFFAGAAFLLALLAATGQIHWGTGHVALWGLFVGLGLIVGGGGVAAVLLEDNLEGDPAFGYDERESVLVSRREWDAVQARLGELSDVTAEPTPAPPTPSSPSVERTVELIQELERLAAEDPATSPSPLTVDATPAPDVTPSRPRARRRGAVASSPSPTLPTAPVAGGTRPGANADTRPPRAPPRPARPANPADWAESEKTAEPPLTPELLDLLRELDPTLVPTAPQPALRQTAELSRLCAGCATALDERGARYRCVSCWKELCSACRERATRAKRAALCAECAAAAGVDPRK